MYTVPTKTKKNIGTKNSFKPLKPNAKLVIRLNSTAKTRYSIESGIAFAHSILAAIAQLVITLLKFQKFDATT